jgi:hypothetical protein
LPPKYQSALEEKAQFQGNLQTGTRIDNARSLDALYANSAADPSSFLKADPRAMDLTLGDTKKYLDLQNKVKAGTAIHDASDQTFARAWKNQEMTAGLVHLGISGSDTTSAINRLELSGVLHGAIRAFTDSNGRPPNDQELNTKIFPYVFANALTLKHNPQMGWKGTPQYDMAVEGLRLAGVGDPNEMQIADEMTQNQVVAGRTLRTRGQKETQDAANQLIYQGYTNQARTQGKQFNYRFPNANNQ